MATVNIKDFTESKIVRLVDLSDDSINKIAEAVVQKIAEPTEEQVKEYCRKRCIVMVSSELFNEMKARWSRETAKHGTWINISISASGNESSAQCDLCGAIVHNNFSSNINYCPNCGAKMDEVEE